MGEARISKSPRTPGAWIALGVFLLLAVAWTWPLAAHLTSRVAPDPGDPVLNTWILWWNAQAFPFTDRWVSPPVFFPMEGAFALSEHLAGIAVFTTPFQLAGVSPLTTYNVALILSFALSACFTYLLVARILSGAGYPPAVVVASAFCAGMAFGFAPYRISQLSHLQVLMTAWMPLTLLGMHAYLEDGRPRWIALAAIAWLLQALSNGYYMLFFPVLVALWLAWLVAVHRNWRRGAALLAGFAGASLLLLPGLLQYWKVHSSLGLARELTEMRMFSGTLDAFLTPPHGLVFWPDLAFANQETFLFPGITAIALVVLALIARRNTPSSTTNTPLPFFVIATLVMWWFALGPALPEDSALAQLRIYSLVNDVPGYSGLRVPARFAMLGYLCLAVAGGLALPRLLPSRTRWRAVVLAVVATGLFIDGWSTRMPLVPPPGRVVLPDGLEAAAILELPADDEQVNVSAMYRAISHGRPVVNGYSGHVPPHYGIVRDGLRRGDESILPALAIRRPLVVSVHAGKDADGHFQRVVQSVPGVRPLDVTSAGRLFLVPPQPAPIVPPSGAAFPYSLTTPVEDIAQLDLGESKIVRVVTFPLRRHYRELHSRLEITVSEDGETWDVVWLDWTGRPALLGTLEDPRTIPMRFTLPDVRARYLRLRPLPPSLMEEITVHGPS